MKKNAMLKIAAILMVAVLLTTCAISSTFAKYTATSGLSTDTARVAKFGVKVDTNVTTLFAGAYKDEPVVTSVTDDNTTVKTTVDVVAPGTKNTLTAASTITGTPEVDVTVAYSVNVTISEDWLDKDGDAYFPVIFTVNGATYGLEGMKDSEGNTPTNSFATTALLAAGIKEAIELKNATYQAGTTLESQAANKLSISWEWAFNKNSDVNDTYLGDLIAGTILDGEGHPVSAQLGITFAITTTVDQVD